MTKTQIFLRQAFAVVFCAVFLLLSGLCVMQASPVLPLPKLPILEVTIAAVVGWLLFLLGGFWLEKHKTWNVKTARWGEVLGVALFFVLFFVLQLQFARAFYPSEDYGTWDFTNIAYITKQVVAMEQAAPGVPPDLAAAGVDYFQLYPNNIPYFLLLHGVFRLFAPFVSNLHTVGIGLNILFIDLSLLLGYCVMRQLTRHKAAGFLYLGLCLVTLPFLMYTAVYYTDTLTLPFPIGAYLLWLLAKQRWEKGQVRPALWLCGGVAVVSALGMTLKLSAGFILIAIAIDAAVTFPPRRLLRTGAVLLCGFLLVYLPLGALCRSSRLVLPQDPELRVPKLHWVMMGLNGTGTYCDADYQLTLSIPPEERDAFVQQEIQRRVKEMGPAGMLAHLREKWGFTWADGTYFSAVKLQRDQRGPSALDAYFTQLGARFGYVAIFCQGLLLLNLLCAAATGLRLLRRDSDALPLLPCAVAVFGLFLFLTLWETRSRYVYNLLPLFLVMTTAGLTKLAESLADLRKRN